MLLWHGKWNKQNIDSEEDHRHLNFMSETSSIYGRNCKLKKKKKHTLSCLKPFKS